MRNTSVISTLFLLIIISNFTSAQIPLQLENRWDFVKSEWDASGYRNYDTLSIKIYADTTINNKKYYRVTSNPYILDLIRSDTIGVYFYDTTNNKEWLFFRYDLSLGEYIQNRYHLPPSDTNNFINVYKVIDDSSSIFRQFTRRIRYSIVSGVDHAYSISISPQFGFIEIDASGTTLNVNIMLAGCKIGNNIYGELTSITNIENGPNSCQLLANYPNPFNPTTTIEYRLDKSSIVSLKIYNVLGKEVKSLISEMFQTAGIHKVIFNGEGLSSGVYFYRLVLKGNSSALFNKMILLK